MPAVSNIPSSSVTPTAGGTACSTSFGIVTYNVLAKSLGTNMIPWVMKVSPDIQQRILRQQQRQDATTTSTTTTTASSSFDEWVNLHLKPTYLSHFHKNFDSGNYAKMREFWGCKQLQSPQDIPTELAKHLQFVEEDCISYCKQQQPYPQKQDDDDNKKSKKQKTVIQTKTLRGLAKELLCSSDDDEDPQLFQDFFQNVTGLEDQVFSWKVRGPRIFQTLFGGTPNERQRQQESTRPVDILALQEYDFHDVVANYRQAGNDTEAKQETFAQAMMAMDFSGVFLKDPLLGRDPPSGLGLFWNANVFETMPAPGTTAIKTTTSATMESLECNASGFQGAVVNCDLQEHWHPIIPKKDKNASDDVSPSPQLMQAADRRNVGLCRLRHKATGKTLVVCITHLMTTSRDGMKTNRYPGEVRAGELARIQTLVQDFCKNNQHNNDGEDDALILVGDLNTNAADAKTIFGGTISASSDGSDDAVLQFDTGFDADICSLNWGIKDDDSTRDYILVDAFEKQHEWGKQQQGSNQLLIDTTGGDHQQTVPKYCSSRNAARIEWIDYVFYDKKRLDCQHVDESLTPSQPIPNEIHPSDHLPLYARFEFR